MFLKNMQNTKQIYLMKKHAHAVVPVARDPIDW